MSRFFKTNNKNNKDNVIDASKYEEHFDNDKSEIERLKNIKTINPLKKVQIKKEIKRIEQEIEKKKRINENRKKLYLSISLMALIVVISLIVIPRLDKSSAKKNDVIDETFTETIEEDMMEEINGFKYDCSIEIKHKKGRTAPRITIYINTKEKSCCRVWYSRYSNPKWEYKYGTYESDNISSYINITYEDGTFANYSKSENLSKEMTYDFHGKTN